MANRYWVGGTATWDGTAGTKWSATSGGPGGASAPNIFDDVFFDAASTGVCTVPFTGFSQTANSLNFTGFTGTFTGSGSVEIVTSLLISAGMTLTHNGTFIFSGSTTGTIVTNGKSLLSGILINNSSLVFSLGDAINVNSIEVRGGTFNTANFNVTTTGFSGISASTSSSKIINLGSSTITVTSGSINFNNATNLTLNAGTSNVIFTNTSQSINANNQSFYNVSFTNTSYTNHIISRLTSVNNLSVAGRTSAGIGVVAVQGSTTVSGTLTFSPGASPPCRTVVQSNTAGTQATFTCAAIAPLTDIDFCDIVIAGAAAPVSGTRLGDRKNNSGITFTAGANKYVNASGSNWDQNVWGTVPGGSVSINDFPLPQDSVYISNTGLVASQSFTVNVNYGVNTLDMSGRTNSLNFSAPNGIDIYGNFLNINSATSSFFGSATFRGRNTQTITSLGQQFGLTLNINSIGGTVVLLDALTINSASGLNFTTGTLQSNNYSIQIAYLQRFFSSYPKVLSLGSSTVTVVGFQFDLRETSYSGTGTISMTSAGSKTFFGNNILTFPQLNQGGTGTLTIDGSNRFTSLTNTAIGRIQFTGGTTNQFDIFSVNGLAGNLLQLGSTNTTQISLLKQGAWFVGANSVNGGNNTGISFSAGGNDYLSVSYVNGIALAIPTAVSETALAYDLISGGFVIERALSETATITDLTSAIVVLLASIADGSSVSSTPTAQIGFATSLSESVQGFSTASSRASFGVQTSENVGAFATTEALRVLTSAITEAATSQELVAAAFVFSCAIVEAVRGQDSVVSRATLNAVVPELVRASESLIAGNVYNVTLPESVRVADVVASAFLWNPIDDSQVPNWSGISDNQNPNWQNGSTS